MSTSRTLYRQSLTQLQSELPDLLPAEQARTLAAALAPLLAQDSDDAVTRAIRVVAEYPAARARLDALLQQEAQWGGERSAIAYEPPGGDPDAIPAGTVVVCPADPDHYRRVVQFQGQQFTCPQHHKQLVPATSVSPEGSP